MIYDAFGQLVAEYGAPADGMGGVKYVQQDHQGSVRTVTNSNGFVIARTDQQAFGDTVGAGVGLRNANQSYGTDPSTRQGYGLTESDESSGQQHTWFRKLETQAGRFSSPDPYKGSMSLGDPQSFNRYSYVNSQPTNFVDPSGLINPVPAGCTVVYPGDGGGVVLCSDTWSISRFESLGLPDRTRGLGDPLLPKCPSVPKAPPNVSVDDNIREAYKHKLPTDFGSVLATVGSIANVANAGSNGKWFYDRVKNAKGRKSDVEGGSSWDYKQLGSEYEAFGNFNFGATGRALGLPTEVILRGAGAAQILAGSSPGGSGTPIDPGSSSYGDDPVDQAIIKAGIKYYDDGCY